ncbi:oxidoreductase [Pseudomonas oryzihabitans]|uniref:oxidoreductase n=1 Tax=Pseudomonas oryzihabitans TaxID=47885 RepID=UPI0028653E38|nr:oxidoreductase [Pseudomonas psychrotolerans]MDR6678440.1 NAD(P)-dependent dehydrogenase (short-subunit alcohol dehydrogenase family) [Pseudomonas psychrotolerans]
MNDHQTLFITGVSSGFGQALAREALAAGHRVIGTVRREADRQAFAALSPNAHGVLLDVTDYARLATVVAEVQAEHGPVDVLVNNAGYGHEGILEESPLEELRQQFEVNVFAAVAMIKAFLPAFRQRRRGHIINITSMGGTITLPGISYYCGSKFALEGISAALGQELEPFGVQVTAVAPGSFRTDWAGRSMRRTPRSIPDYDESFAPIRAAREAKSGKQLGDPRKAAQALLQLIAMPAPPRQLLLGSDALQLVRERLAGATREIERWETLTRSTDG